MEKKTHDAAKDPEAVLHFAQELDSASTGDAKTGASSPEPEPLQTPAASQPPQTPAAEKATGQELPNEEHHDTDTDEDDPGLVARMTAKGALWGF